MIKHSTRQKFAVASAIALFFISAQAQAADGILVLTGQVNANTCKLSISDTNGFTNNGTRSIELGSVTPAQAPNTADTTFGTSKTINFGLTDLSGLVPCSTGTGNWNIVLDVQAGQVATAIGDSGSRSYLTNSATTNAAGNIGIALSESNGSRISNIVTGGGYFGGTKISSTSAAVNGGTLSLIASFVTTSTEQPTPGLFSATVPLLVTYN